MPIPLLIPLAGGALLGGGAVWAASSAAEKIATVAAIGGLIYFYVKAK